MSIYTHFEFCRNFTSFVGKNLKGGDPLNKDIVLWLALLYLLKRTNCFSNAELLCFLALIVCQNLALTSASGSSCCNCNNCNA